MTDAKTLLRYLPSYKGEKLLLEQNQDVNDIIKAMESFHKKYSRDYDQIAKYFVGKNSWETCQNIFDFLKRNCSYYVEGLEGQTVRNPSAILATGKLDGIDCKNYSLFIGGILSACNRLNLQKIPFAYRYAQTDFFDDYFNHVFIVVNPNTNKEFFVDPIPEVKQMDDRFPIYSFTDKNFETMLYGLSGQQKRQVGFTIPGIGVDTDDVADVFSFATKFFGNRANPEDWRGWDEQDRANGQWVGSSVRGWVLNDGDDPRNEAVNIVSYIKANGLKNLTNSGHPTTIVGQGWRDVTIDEIENKLQRAGFYDEADQFKRSAINTPINSNPMLSNQNTTSGGSSNTLLYIAGALLLGKILKLY